MPSALHIFKYYSVLTTTLKNRRCFYHFVKEKNSKTLRQFPQGRRIGNGRAGTGPRHGHRGRVLYMIQQTKLADGPSLAAAQPCLRRESPLVLGTG